MCTTRNAKESFLVQMEIMLDSNLDVEREIKKARNGNYGDIFNT